jgi:septum site-determining protein MinC
MPDPVRPLRSMRFRGRSYIALVLTPEAPVFNLLADLDAWTRRSAGFFLGKPVVLDLSALVLSKDAVAHLVAELQMREIASWASKALSRPRSGPSCRRC